LSSARIAAGAAAANAGPGVIVGATSADWELWQVGSRTVWNPVANLDLSVDLMYQGVNTAFAGGTSTAGSTLEDKRWFSGMFRVQRNFYP
jgi:hypothetical protein